MVAHYLVCHRINQPTKATPLPPEFVHPRNGYDWLTDFERTCQLRVKERKRRNGTEYIAERYHTCIILNGSSTLFNNKTKLNLNC